MLNAKNEAALRPDFRELEQEDETLSIFIQ